MPEKIAIVVQRYGLEINGGAEYHARLIAQMLASRFTVEVFTTTAFDYVTWEHHYPEGTVDLNGIRVNRFKVVRPRDPHLFGQIQQVVFEEEHALSDELKWLEEEGPLVPHLLDTLAARQAEFSFLIFFSYRYFHSFHGLHRFGRKAILVPTAEHDETIYMRVFKDIFHLPGAIIYNSHEERELIHRVSANQQVPGDIVGVGSEIPLRFDPSLARAKFSLSDRYYIYIGRLDENKGVPELLRFHLRMQQELHTDLTLVLAGKSVISIPEHPRIRYLGFISDQEKFDLLAGSEFLVIPSQFESLSMVALEAWALGKPVLANGRTEVLRGQCQRSHAGLWYENFEEFREVVSLLEKDPGLRDSLGRNGRTFFSMNYSWPEIEKKYLNIFSSLGMQKTL